MANNMRTYKANIQLGDYSRTDVYVEAMSQPSARKLVESCYPGRQIFGVFPCNDPKQSNSNSSFKPTFNFGGSSDSSSIWLFLLFMSTVVLINYWYIVLPIALVLAVILAWKES